ncbi:hypothetical protein [Dyella acidiphila]|uniref:Uncharacterized protein n=1 Tax=Dyella acidiphila TaxID=2775866 RepID=A0ABR9GFL2_9GAMM|nr:hypothetical protein [Dyella acidiphila]MBE1162818.1 hypothetical protein [Dyella acidiphila]
MTVSVYLHEKCGAIGTIVHGMTTSSVSQSVTHATNSGERDPIIPIAGRLRIDAGCGLFDLMNLSRASHLLNNAAIPARVCVAAVGLNNNANNNTRHHGWAGV